MECIFQARDQIDRIWGAIEECDVDPTTRSKFVSTMLFVAFNHCDGIQTLAQKKNFASAYALVRPLLETSFRAIWLHRCANDLQLNNCMGKDKWKSAWDLIQEIEAEMEFSPTLSNLWSEMLPLMHSFTHGGVQNAIRHLGNGNTITPNVPDEEVLQLMQTVGLLSWFIFGEFVDLSKDNEQLHIYEDIGNNLYKWAF